jgi:predicted transcriptional regulator
VAIKIPFIADVTAFLGGTRKLEESLDDVADSLDDIGTAGSDVERKVGSDLDGVARAADDSADKISRSFRDAFNDVEAAGRTSSRKVKADVDDVGHKGSATLQEFSSEAKQNVAESVSSFNGSASSAVDAIQSTFGGLVSALGPAGLVGAAAIGVGIGFARSLFSKSQEAAEEFRGRVLDIFEELRSSAGDISPEFKMDTLAGIISDAEELKKAFDVDNLDDFRAVLDQTGLSVGQLQTYFSGLTGDAGELAGAQSLLEEQVISLHDALLDPTASLTQQTQARDQITAIRSLQEALDDQGNAYGDARAKADLLNQLMPATTDAAEAEAGARRDSADALGSENEQLRISAGLKGDAVANELDMRDALDDVTKARKDNGESLSKHTAAGRDNLRAVRHAMDGIKAYGDALVDNGAKSGTATKKMEDQEKVLVHKVAKAFGISETAAKAYIKTLGGIPPAKDTKVTVSDHGTAKSTANTIDHAIPDHMDLPVKVTYKPSDTVLKQIQRHLNSYTFKVDVDARPGQPT